MKNLINDYRGIEVDTKLIESVYNKRRVTARILSTHEEYQICQCLHSNKFYLFEILIEEFVFCSSKKEVIEKEMENLLSIADEESILVKIKERCS